MQKQLGNATFDVHVGYEDFGSEQQGECCWNLNVGSLRRIFARFPKLATFGMIPDAIGDAIEYGGEDSETLKEGKELAETLDDFTDEKIILIRDTDAGIVLIRAMAEIGGEWKLEWYGENKTWFFHDWDHAIHDTDVTSNGPEISGIDWDSERRAQVNGAREALRNGVSIDDVCEAVGSILEEFESRFKAPIGSIWSDIFRGFEISK
jgi:hypothetical protein